MSFNEEDHDKEPSSFDEEIEEEKKEGVTNFTVVSRVGTFFGWLGELITEQARIEAQTDAVAEPPLHMVHEIKLRQQKTSEVIANAKVICNHLDDIKQKLSVEFGSTASCFISKCINPMIDHARQLIGALENPPANGNNSGNGSLQGLLDQAIESVELYSQFNDESKLKRKIVQVAQGFIKQMIDKDLEVLANYKHHAFENCNFSEDEKQNKEFQLDRYLYPIVSELVGMAESRIETDDLHAFLVWKTNVDDRRNSLLELGYLTIDAMVGQTEAFSTISEADKDGEDIVEEPFTDLIKHQLEDTSLAMSFLALLEDRASDIFIRLEENEPDPDSVDIIQQLLDFLKVDAERFEAISAHTKHVLDSFHQLKENLTKAESLLQVKRIT